MNWIKKIRRAITPNPLDAICKKAIKENKKTFLIVWNRGLGDIPLLLYGMVDRILELIPEAKITFITRKSIEEGFFLLPNVDVIGVDDWERNKPCDLQTALLQIGKKIEDFDVVIEKPDPTYWVGWQVGRVTPKLSWQKKWDELFVKKFENLLSNDNGGYVGVQVATEAGYNTFRDWPANYWNNFFSYLEKKNQKVLLFGSDKNLKFFQKNIIDLRGETTILELLSIIKNRCHTLVLLDSSILALTYYLDEKFPIVIFSLWADSTLGVLKQNVPSPNSSLSHVPLIAEKNDLKNITPDHLIHLLPLR